MAGSYTCDIYPLVGWFKTEKNQNRRKKKLNTRKRFLKYHIYLILIYIDADIFPHNPLSRELTKFQSTPYFSLGGFTVFPHAIAREVTSREASLLQIQTVGPTLFLLVFSLRGTTYSDRFNHQ